jgi:hypothetical protein
LQEHFRRRLGESLSISTCDGARRDSMRFFVGHSGVEAFDCPTLVPASFSALEKIGQNAQFMLRFEVVAE